MLSEHGMKIAPGTYYRWLACPVRQAELEEAYLVNAIVDLYRRNKCVYGVRKMWHAARRAGVRIGRDQVSTGGDAGDESSRQLVPTPADSEHRDRDTHPWRRPSRT